jgi:uncharacterized spore protein YtfJ
MNEFLDKLGVTITTSHEQNLNLIQKLFETARPSAVFSEPLRAGDYTVITAAEVVAGGGVGYGGGGGTGPAEVEVEELDVADEIPVEAIAEDDEGFGEGYGVGGGGGGYTWARPVAAITIGPDGVTVEPIVDATKVAIALFTTIGAMALMFARMSKLSQK